MDTCILGVAGGSGSGKSTLAVALCKKYPHIFALLHLDDYYKKKEEVPLHRGFTNWEHPEALRFEDVVRDITALKEGKPITFLTKGELYNPNFDVNLRNKIEHTLEPKPILILEGFLALSQERIRDLLDYKIFLDIPIEESIRRRSGNKFMPDEDYFTNVVVPMHEKYVAPTRKYADLVLDVSTLSAEEVLAVVEEKLKPLLEKNGAL